MEPISATPRYHTTGSNGAIIRAAEETPMELLLYVLPFLLGDRLVARGYIESEAEAGTIGGALCMELRTMAVWLGLDSLVINRRTGFSRSLADALRWEN